MKAALANFDPYTKKTFLIVCCLAPIYFGLIALLLGPDTNWDLRNYHIYNPYAFLNNRMAIDLAPAGMQSYFNPLLDVPYFVMTLYLPAPLVGFIMGTLHGLNFSLLGAITYKTLPDLPANDRIRIPLLLTVLGCMTANYLSGLGNTMGDDATSIFILGTLLIVMTNWECICNGAGRSIFIVIFAGLVAGLGGGLKMTNIPYVTALCLSFFVVPVRWTERLWLSIVFGVGALMGVVATGGYWFYKMWITFGNPLYPQFSRYFPDPLLKSAAVHDLSWVPKNFTETVLWPFIFSLDNSRVGELFTRQIIWAVVYMMVGLWGLTFIIKNWKQQSRTRLPAQAQYILLTIAIGYVIWMKLFSVQRYLVPLEVCLPLILFFLVMQMMSYRHARATAIVLLMISTAMTIGGGLQTWGHASWSQKMFRVDIPKLESAEKTTVILVGDDPVFGWMTTQFPGAVAFVSAGNSLAGMSNMPVYIQKIHNIVDRRGGPVFAVIPTFEPTDHQGVTDAQERLRTYGYSFDPASCSVHSAMIGDQNLPFQWCAARKL